MSQDNATSNSCLSGVSCNTIIKILFVVKRMRLPDIVLLLLQSKLHSYDTNSNFTYEQAKDNSVSIPHNYDTNFNFLTPHTAENTPFQFLIVTIQTFSGGDR